MEQLQAAVDDATTNFTATLHRAPYPAISPTRPELSQAGKTILVTGGGTGIGKAIARNFALASAATIIIVARQADRLKDAVEELAKTAKDAKSPTKFIARSCDITNSGEVTALWDYLAAQGIRVDVLVLNAAKFSPMKSLFELGIEEVWSQFEVNVKGPLHFAELFSKQDGEGEKFLVNVSTAAIHTLQNPVVAARPAYSLTKASGTLAVQILANSITPDKLQIVSFHPGTIYGLGWAESGITKDMLPFDDVNLPGAFAVWAASREAKFLHGRYVFASWDVDEISGGETRQSITNNADYLRIAVTGLKGARRA